MTTSNTPGRGWAYIGALLGGAVSVAANIAHSYIPPIHAAAASWSPDTGAVIGSVFWPIALFVAVEILTRIPWPAGKGWTMLRFGGLLPVALVAAVVSYRHLSGLLDHYSEDTLTVTIGPLAVDGLMIMATGALLATGHATRAVNAANDTEPATEMDNVPDSLEQPETVATEPVPSTTDTRVEPEPATVPQLAPWTFQPPARVNGHTPAEVSQ
ncbi:hypothetical protein [Actinocatenispora comari]|uniref:DUF2637 domain-containing protein n=1 Tax=Actinocatenispora comari TaxID=2807577 RepID=A0A8J4EP38_9ACTN|nr:hypothetical protein [Actinocatenispora comari]GIL30443.1 hypothetical protein NUM_56970 [Actinocatenispora comari]